MVLRRGSASGRYSFKPGVWASLIACMGKHTIPEHIMASIAAIHLIPNKLTCYTYGEYVRLRKLEEK